MSSPAKSGNEQPEIRKGQGKVKLSRDEFARRLGERFYDPAFDSVRSEIDRIIGVAWTAYDDYHKSPRKRKAGPEFADPEFELPVEWLEARAAVLDAERRQRDPSAPRRVLVVCGAARHDMTCPGEMSKTFRLVQLAREIVEASEGFDATCSTSATSPPSTAVRSSLARPASPPRCRFATGPAPATSTTRWAR